MPANGSCGLGALTVDIVPLGVADTPFELPLEVMSVGLSGNVPALDDDGGARERFDVVEMSLESTDFLSQILCLASVGTCLGEFLSGCLIDRQSKMEPASVLYMLQTSPWYSQPYWG